MRITDLGVPVGLIASLVGVFYCLGVFEVQDLTLLPREPDRSQIAPATPIAALPPHAPVSRASQAPAPTAPQPEKAALAALEAARETSADVPLTPPLPSRSTPSAKPPQAQLLYGASAADSAQYQQQIDELPTQTQAAEASVEEQAQEQAELQAQALDAGTDYDPRAAASDAIEYAQQFQPAALEGEEQQQ